MIKTILVFSVIFIVVLQYSAFTDKVSSLVEEGNKNYNQGDFEGAIDCYRKALVHDDDSVYIRYNIGNALYKMCQYDDADTIYSRLINKSESTKYITFLLFNMGNTYYRLGKYQPAQEMYRKVLEIDPNDVDAKYNLEFLNRKMENINNDNDEKKQERHKKYLYRGVIGIESKMNQQKNNLSAQQKILKQQTEILKKQYELLKDKRTLQETEEILQEELRRSEEHNRKQKDDSKTSFQRSTQNSTAADTNENDDEDMIDQIIPIEQEYIETLSNEEELFNQNERGDGGNGRWGTNGGSPQGLDVVSVGGGSGMLEGSEKGHKGMTTSNHDQNQGTGVNKLGGVKSEELKRSGAEKGEAKPGYSEKVSSAGMEIRSKKASGRGKTKDLLMNKSSKTQQSITEIAREAISEEQSQNLVPDLSKTQNIRDRDRDYSYAMNNEQRDKKILLPAEIGQYELNSILESLNDSAKIASDLTVSADKPFNNGLLVKNASSTIFDSVNEMELLGTEDSNGIQRISEKDFIKEQDSVNEIERKINRLNALNAERTSLEELLSENESKQKTQDNENSNLAEQFERQKEWLNDRIIKNKKESEAIKQEIQIFNETFAGVLKATAEQIAHLRERFSEKGNEIDKSKSEINYISKTLEEIAGNDDRFIAKLIQDIDEHQKKEMNKYINTSQSVEEQLMDKQNEIVPSVLTSNKDNDGNKQLRDKNKYEERFIPEDIQSNIMSSTNQIKSIRSLSEIEQKYLDKSLEVLMKYIESIKNEVIADISKELQRKKEIISSEIIKNKKLLNNDKIETKQGEKTSQNKLSDKKRIGSDDKTEDRYKRNKNNNEITKDEKAEITKRDKALNFMLDELERKISIVKNRNFEEIIEMLSNDQNQNNSSNTNDYYKDTESEEIKSKLDQNRDDSLVDKQELPSIKDIIKVEKDNEEDVRADGMSVFETEIKKINVSGISINEADRILDSIAEKEKRKLPYRMNKNTKKSGKDW